MTGYPEFNYPAFTEAAQTLRAAGWEVVSPHEVPHPENGVVGSLDWTTYLRADLRELVTCAAVALLDGWPQSKGARLELTTALALDMRVYHYRAGRLVDMNRPAAFLAEREGAQQ